MTKIKHTKLFSGILIICGFFSTSTSLCTPPVQNASSTQKPIASPLLTKPASIASILNWVSDKKNTDLCEGQFHTPSVLKKNFPAPNINDPRIDATSTGPDNTLKLNGTSTLQGKITIAQPDLKHAGRIAHSTRALITRKDGKIEAIELPKPFSLEEANLLIKGLSGSITPPNNSYILNTVNYRIKPAATKNGTATPTRTYWGKAQQIHHQSDGKIELKNATCSTCNPKHASWYLKAQRITFHPEKQYAVAKNMVLYFNHIPTLYLPYIVFPTDYSRHSGFLFPSFAYKKHGGSYYQQPYYWNIAPNYDATITPGLYKKSGLQINTLFRFLTRHSNGKIYLSYLPHDSGFDQYKSTINQSGITGKDTYLSQLNKMSNKRAYLSAQSLLNLSPNLTATINLNAVTDPYFFRDFRTPKSNNQSSQLTNQIALNYTNQHWQFFNVFSAYQALHRIDTPAISNQYQRLPELDFNGNYEHLAGPLFTSLNGQYVNFLYHSKFSPVSADKNIGQRLHLEPILGMKFKSAKGYIIPSISLDMTAYRSQLASQNTLRPKSNHSITIPITSVDSGMFLEKNLNWNKNHYWQTLEPRLKYTYIPYRNQSQLPLFDTAITPFDFSSLFSNNQFSSFDRLQNTNQFSLGVTSRILNQKDASQLIQTDLGVAYFMSPQKVCLTPQCQAIKEHVSPLYADLNFGPIKNLTVTTAAAWNLKNHYLDNASLSLQYSKPNKQAADLSYIESHDNGKLVKFGATTPLTRHLSTLGYIEYDLSKKKNNHYLLGFQYDTCCWTAQIIYDNPFPNTTTTPQNLKYLYKNSIYFQFMLKGLGSFGHGTGSANSVLATNIPDFNNPFQKN
jgi:LPS-assembly protein